MKVIAFTLILFVFSYSSTFANQHNLNQIINQTNVTLQNLSANQTSLHAANTPDSLHLQQTLDSLKHLNLEPANLKHKVDSLQQVVLDKLRTINKGNISTEKIYKSGKQVKQTISSKVFTTEVNQVNISQELPAKFNNIKSNLSDWPLPEKLPSLPALKKLPNADAVTELAKQEATKIAENYFTQHENELSQARAELNKYKGRLEKVESLQDLPKGGFKLNPLRDKPWMERVVFGTQWQFSKQERYRIDLGPTVAWLFTDKLSVGAGFQYRLSVSAKQKPWVNSSDKVFGYSVFSDFQVKKGFFGRLHYAILNTSVSRLNLLHQTEAVEQLWVKGLSVGIGKSYTFYKHISGYALMQYNLLHRAGESPYFKPIQAKIGFYLNGKHLRAAKN